MATIQTINLTGASGRKYGFEVYPADTVFPSGIACIYFVSRRNPDLDGRDAHYRIYIGEAGDLKQRLETRFKQDCFEFHGYNTICIHRVENKMKRFAAEIDLIHGLKPPCNYQYTPLSRSRMSAEALSE